MPASGESWLHCSPIQFRAARGAAPLHFQKGALILLACELALADRIKAKKAAKELVPGDVYRHMSIISACWYIDDFDRIAFKELIEKHPNALTNLRDAAKQKAKTFLDHMAKGHTVTRPTATAVKEYIDKNVPGLRLGAVNPKPGRELGHLQATDFEHIDAG
jgi:hypothetical protein